MIDPERFPQSLQEAGVASAEKGLVVLDGWGGIAVTMTPQCATDTGNSLISAAAEARNQAPAQNDDASGET